MSERPAAASPFPRFNATVSGGVVSDLRDAALDVIDFYQAAERFGGRWQDVAHKIVAIARQYLIDHPVAPAAVGPAGVSVDLPPGVSVDLPPAVALAGPFLDTRDAPPPDAEESELERRGWKRTGLWVNGRRVYETYGGMTRKDAARGCWELKLDSRTFRPRTAVEADQMVRIHRLLFSPVDPAEPEADEPVEAGSFIPNRKDYSPD